MTSVYRTFEFWRKWLIVISFGAIIVGILFPFLSTVDFIAAEYNRALAKVFFDQESLSAEMLVYNQWVWGMLGAVISAWAVCMLLIAIYPFNKREKWAWYSIGGSLTIAFILDVGISIYFKFYAEVILALIWFISGILPVAGTYKFFFRR